MGNEFSSVEALWSQFEGVMAKDAEGGGSAEGSGSGGERSGGEGEGEGQAEAEAEGEHGEEVKREEGGRGGREV